MSTLPLVSVIVPTRNRAGQLTACLQALHGQNYPPDRLEVVVVNDGGEKVPAIIGGRQRLTAVDIIEIAHGGPAAARNAGAERARGDVLAFIDDDCSADPQWVSSMVGAIARHPDAVIGGRVINVLRDNRYARASQLLVSQLYRYYHEERRGLLPFFTTNNLATSAETFAHVGPFDPSFLFASEDRDWCDRSIAAGRSLRYAPEAVVHHAHALTLASFFHQHFRYGAGARRFHRARARRRQSGIRLERPAFYSGMVRAPFAAGDPEAIRISMLIIASQVVGAAGWALAGLRGEAELRR